MDTFSSRHAYLSPAEHIEHAIEVAILTIRVYCADADIKQLWQDADALKVRAMASAVRCRP